MLLVEKKINKEIKKVDKYHQIDKKNTIAACLKEVSNIVKANAMDTARKMTDEHRRILRQFVAFKERTIDYLKDMEDFHTRMKVAEKDIALRNPINEAIFALDDLAFDNHALRLYNCLVPKIKTNNYRWEACNNSIR